MKRILTAVLLAGISLSVFGTTGGILFDMGHGPQLGMGGASLVSTGPCVELWNPAGLASVQALTVSSSSMSMYVISGFDLSMPYVNFSAAFPVGSFGLAADYSFLRIDDYKTSLCQLSAGTSLRAASVGVSVKFYDETIDGIAASGVDFDIGTQIQISDTVGVGIVVRNLMAAEIGEGQALNTIVSAGLSVRPVEWLRLEADADLPIGDDMRQKVRIGAEATYSGLSLRCGTVMPIRNLPETRFTAGLGAEWGAINIDLTWISHPTLGGSLVGTFSLTF